MNTNVSKSVSSIWRLSLFDERDVTISTENKAS